MSNEKGMTEAEAIEAVKRVFGPKVSVFSGDDEVRRITGVTPIAVVKSQEE